MSEKVGGIRHDGLVSSSGSAAHIYVVGEREEPSGFVKIGMSYTTTAKGGRAGLSTGNWRELVVEHVHEMPAESVRWWEFVIHEHLAPWRIRGEWFDVRPLLADGLTWSELLDAAMRQQIPEGCSVELGAGGHRLEVIKVLRWRPPREAVAHCSCGFQLRGTTTTVPALYRKFLALHTQR